MRRLTREEVIENHRNMWNWIADQNEQLIDKEKIEPIGKANYFYIHNIPISEYPRWECYLCEYGLQQVIHDTKSKCDFCPLDWSNDGETSDRRCENENSTGLYEQFMTGIELKDPKICSDIARIIANLSEK